MNVTIDGITYVPVSQTLDKADETAKAIIRMLVSGHYTSLGCHKTGENSGDNIQGGCECSACKCYRLAVQYLGSAPEAGKEPLIHALWSKI